MLKEYKEPKLQENYLETLDSLEADVIGINTEVYEKGISEDEEKVIRRIIHEEGNENRQNIGDDTDNIVIAEKIELVKAKETLENKYLNSLENLRYERFLEYHKRHKDKIDVLFLKHMQGEDVSQFAKDLEILTHLIAKANIRVPRFARPDIKIRQA